MKYGDQKFYIWLTNHLRAIHHKWPGKKIAKDLALVEEGEFTIVKKGNRSRNKYRCAHCDGIFRNKEIAVDHIDPVVNPETGFVDWNQYVMRLFIPHSSYQILCTDCHQKKTNEENAMRRR